MCNISKLKMYSNYNTAYNMSGGFGSFGSVSSFDPSKSIVKLLHNDISIATICKTRLITADDYKQAMDANRNDMICHMVQVLKLPVPFKLFESMFDCDHLGTVGISMFNRVFIAALKLWKYEDVVSRSHSTAAVIYNAGLDSIMITNYINNTPYHKLVHEYIDQRVIEMTNMKATLKQLSEFGQKKRKLTE